MKPLRMLSLSAPIILACLTGCSVNSPQPPVKLSLPADGQVISMTPLKVQGAPDTVNIYKMIYWSDKTKTEALVEEPKIPGSYPLYVMCHGGWAVPEPTVKHDTQDATPVSYFSHPSTPGFIVLVPEYRGYADSDGTVQGLDGDTLDTNNAINAILHRDQVLTGHIYLDGVSMGGGVVLDVASKRHDIRSVIAVSPFVGWNIVGPWAEQNAKSNARAEDLFTKATTAYGPIKPGSAVFNANSIDVKNITAPVLILQGKSDDRAPWQTVESFYKEMLGDNKTVQLNLYPNANHGLTNDWPDLEKAVNQWNAEYGE